MASTGKEVNILVNVLHRETVGSDATENVNTMVPPLKCPKAPTGPIAIYGHK